MATRDYQGIQLAQGTRGPAPVVSAPISVPDSPEGRSVEVSAWGQMVKGLLDSGAELADENAELAAEDAYLEGQRQRSLGTAQEQLQGDVFSRRFLHGGYNAQDFRIKQAEFAQEQQQFIDSDGKTLDPEAYTASLREGAAAIVGMIGPGMSRRDRSAALAQQAQTEQALIQYQAKAHAQYGLDRKAAAYTTQGNQINDQMIKARDQGDDQSYLHAAGRAALFVQDVLQGDELPETMREQVAVNYMKSLASADHWELIESIRGTGAFDEMSYAQRVELDNAIRAAKSRTADRDALAYIQGNASIRARLQSGELSKGELATWVEREVTAGRMTAAQGENHLLQWYKSASDHTTRMQLVQAAYSGDVAGILGMGATLEESIVALGDHVTKQGGTLAQRQVAMLQAGGQIGTYPRELGTALESAFTAIATNPENMNPDQLQLAQTFLDTYDISSVNNPAAAQRLLEVLPERTRGHAAVMIGAARRGVDPYTALARAQENGVAFREMAPHLKYSMSKQMTERAVDHMRGEFGFGGFSRLVSYATGNARPSSNPHHLSYMRMELEEEIRSLATDPNNLALFGGTDEAEKALIDVATTSLQERMVPVHKDGRWGNDTKSWLIVPRGTTVESVFGSDIGTDLLGRELARNWAEPVTKDHDVAFHWRQGNVVRIDVDENGAAVPGSDTVIPMGEVIQGIRTNQERRAKEQRAADFGGYAYVSDSNTGKTRKFEISGENISALPTRPVLRWRRDLLRYNPRMDLGEGDNIAYAEQAFRKETDAVLQSSMNLLPELGMQPGTPSHLLVAEGMYRVGREELARHESYGAVIDAIAARDTNALKEAVEATPWYKRDPEEAESWTRRMTQRIYELRPR